MTQHDGPWNGLTYLQVAEFGTYTDAEEIETTDIEKAQAVTSRVAEPRAWLGPDDAPRHRVVLDIDMEAELIPSSTPGHYHLYLDHELPWPKYEALLLALAAAGVIEEGYAEACIRRGASCVRLPWVKKERSQADVAADCQPPRV